MKVSDRVYIISKSQVMCSLAVNASITEDYYDKERNLIVTTMVGRISGEDQSF